MKPNEFQNTFKLIDVTYPDYFGFVRLAENWRCEQFSLPIQDTIELCTVSRFLNESII